MILNTVVERISVDFLAVHFKHPFWKESVSSGLGFGFLTHGAKYLLEL